METTKRTKYGFYVVALGIAILVAIAGPAAVAQSNWGTPTGDSSEVRRQCDELLNRARACMAGNDLSGAEMLISQAEQFNPSYSFLHTGDTPAKAREALEARKAQAVQLHEPFAARDAMVRPVSATVPAGPTPKQQSDDLLLSARRELASGRPDDAENLVRQVQALRLSYAQNDDTPDYLQAQIATYRDLTRRQQSQGHLPAYRQDYCLMLVDQAKALAWRGDLQAAAYIANQAANLQVQVADPSDDPQALLTAIQRSQVTEGGATQASYTPATDSTHAQVAQATIPEIPIPAVTSAPPAPIAQGPNAYDLYQRGLAALEVQDRATALNYFHQANAVSSQLDPTTRQQLQDKLQMLTTVVTPSAAQRPSLIDGAAVTQSALIDQYRAEVNEKMSLVDRMLETAPTRAYDAISMLEETKASIMAAEFDPQSRDMLVQRLDIKIEQCRTTVALYAGDIALEQQNQQVYDVLDAERAAVIDMQEQLKQLVLEFNQLMEEERYAEAVEVGKRARAIAPDEPVAEQLFRTAQMVYRSDRYRDIRDQIENGRLDNMVDVDRGLIMPDFGAGSMFYGPEWATTAALRGDMTEIIADGSTLQDLDIRRQLKSVRILLDYQQPTPLSQVIYDLMQQANINMRLDDEGLRQANLNSSDTVQLQFISELTLENALLQILEPKGLTYCVRNGACVITTPELARGPMVTKPYYVGDLVIPIPNFMPNPNMGLASALQQAYQTAGGFRNGGTLGQTFGGMSNSVIPMTPNGDTGTRARIDPFTMNQMANSMTNPPVRSGGGSRPATGSQGGGSQADFGAIMDLITETVEPESWDSWGGPGTISEFEGNLSLVIRQTEDVHNEIAELLQQLRKMQDLQITIEVRFITLNDNYFERIGLDFDFDIDSNIADNVLVGGGTGQVDPDDDTVTGVTTPELTTVGGQSISVGMAAPGVFSTDLDIPFQQNSFGLAVPQFGNYDITAGAQLGFAILSDIEAFFFIAAAQGDTKSNVLQAPKVTLFNGQMATVADQSQTPFVTGSIPVVGDFAAAQQPVVMVLSEGTFLSVQAVVDNSRKYVRLTVIPFFSQIEDVDTFTFTGEESSEYEESEDLQGDISNPNNSTVQRSAGASMFSRSGTSVQLPSYAYLNVSTTVSVPDGGTILLGGVKRLSEGRNEFGVPLLSHIPYVDRLFRNVSVGRETQSLMMMVTPRIIIQEEEEERIGLND